MQRVVSPASGGESAGAGAHTSIYCLVPEALADELLAPLRAHYRGDADVTVIVDRRAGAFDSTRPQKERRRPVAPRRLASMLPPELAEHAGELRWEQRLAPVRRRLQHATLTALLELIAEHDDDAYSELWWRYAARVHARLASRFGDRAELDHAMRQTFGRLFDEIPRSAHGSRSLEALVASTADAVARAADRSPAGG